MNEKRQFQKYLTEAISGINEMEFDKAKQAIMKAIDMDAAAPEPHNLLGILAEYESDRQLAARHYRASSALDPTYLPAQNNLGRVTSTNGFVMKPKDLGINETSDDKPYYVEFDSDNIGHVKKKMKSQGGL